MIFVVLAVLVVRYQIAAPLTAVLNHLTGASDQVRASSRQINTRQPVAGGWREQTSRIAGGNQRFHGRTFLHDQVQR